MQPRGIKSIDLRFAHIVLKKAYIGCNIRAGELTEEDLNKIASY